MYGRWFNISVVILWLSAMGWLVSQKVLPPLLVGEPPNYRTILAAQQRQPTVAWRMAFNGRQLGWALSTISRLPDEVTEIRSLVHFDELPLAEMTPGWLRTLLRWTKQPNIKLQMDARSTLAIDPLGRLSRFESAVRLDPVDDVVKLYGIVDGSQLRLEVCSGDFSYHALVHLPSDSLPEDALSPQTQLPGLRAGQTWTVPVYSPLRPPNEPLEILQAKVEGIESLVWDGRSVETWLVVYRS
ncbi:MAG: hypothetical protein A2V70_06150, partial [Planctomycetes bacterium RBG_13_63_9]